MTTMRALSPRINEIADTSAYAWDADKHMPFDGVNHFPDDRRLWIALFEDDDANLRVDVYHVDSGDTLFSVNLPDELEPRHAALLLDATVEAFSR